jgi:hypothetical protein
MSPGNKLSATPTNACEDNERLGGSLMAELATAGLDTIAMRMPSLPVARDIRAPSDARWWHPLRPGARKDSNFRPPDS